MTDRDDTIATKRCFVITPIGGDQSDERRHANMVFEVALYPVLQGVFALQRADLSTEPGQITPAIFSALNEADLCIADLTFLNPNVLYELGVRHALQKPVIQIAEKNTRLPFDTANQRTLFFDLGDVHSLQKLGQDVLDQAKWIDAHPERLSNPLTAALGIFANAAEADPQAEIVNQLIARVQALEASIGKRTAPAIMGQGDLATKNTLELQRLWRADQASQSLEWKEEEGGGQSAQYKGFVLSIRPTSKGRWASSAVEENSGYSVPWPIWQSSADDAKSTIVRAVDAALAERTE
ncbi:MAG TPA: hypothetical protein VIT45_01965 [Allosphingosinicella sp.]